MGKTKKVFTNIRVIIVLVCLVLAIVAIYPNPYKKGVAIRNVISNSSANLAGIQSPKPTSAPMSREIITAVNNKVINDVREYHNALNTIKANTTVQIKTNKGVYRLITKERNGTVEDIGIRVYEVPKTNIRKGLDLQGGTRVLLQPEERISQNDMENLIAVMQERLNVYGLSDLIVRTAGDLSGNQYILVEIAGATEEEVKGLLASQGKFEAKIKNETVFKGGEDITYVCRSADCAGIDPTQGCSGSGNGWGCTFAFRISLSPEAAQRQAEATRDLEIITENKRQYLSEKLVLFLDNKQVDELRIGAELKGKAETTIQISGPGIGVSQQEAAINALQNMKRLQTILITGSLPFKLNIVKIDTISPVLGEEFVKNALFAGFVSLVAVALLIYLRYRKLITTIPIIVTLTIEMIILLGIAALIGWNLDLAAIAGIIITIGTGVDDQIVITDEVLAGERRQIYKWRERIKGAFFIIMGAYFTISVAMIPLLFAGAGLLKGFAITTIIGISAGVFITRPAFAQVIEILLKD